VTDERHPLYEIRVRGYLRPERLRHFDGWEITWQPNGETVLVGRVRDQSALFGLLNWLYALGVELLLVRCGGDEELG
jgi:hypothetical protein